MNTSRPIDITRTEFRTAVAAGVAAAHRVGMPPGELVKLLRVGRTATLVGINFEACPLTLAGLYEYEQDGNGNGGEGYLGHQPGSRAFVDAYDSALIELGVFDAPMHGSLYPTCLRVGNGE